MKRIHFILIILMFLIVACDNSNVSNTNNLLVPSENQSNNNIDSKKMNNQENIEQQIKFMNIQMMNDKVGWGIGNEGIYITQNAAYDWIKVNPTDLNWKEIIGEPSVKILNDKLVWIGVKVKNDNEPKTFVFHTKDSGTHWEKTELRLSDWETDPDGNLYLEFIDAKNGWLLITSSPAGGQMLKSLYKTEDSGEHWIKVNDGLIIPGYPTGLTFSNETNGWISAEHRGQEEVPLYVTQDGGVTWKKASVAIPAKFPFPDYYSNAGKPYVEGNDGTLPVIFVGQHDYKVVIYSSQNGGREWKVTNETNLNKLPKFKNLKFGWGTTESDIVITVDGGKNWATLKLDQTEGIQDIDVFGNTVWVLDLSGNLWLSQDNGITWKDITRK